MVNADGDEGNRKTLKSITWPLMDEDALASTYVTKVLTCLSKWRVKMQGLIEVFSLEKEESENLMQNLCRNENLSSLSKFCKRPYLFPKLSRGSDTPSHLWKCNFPPSA